MDEKVLRVLAIVLSDELEPDRINELVETGLSCHEDAIRDNMTFADFEEADRVYNDVTAVFEHAQSRNGSRGWWTNDDKYAPDDERGPRAKFGPDGSVIGTNWD